MTLSFNSPEFADAMIEELGKLDSREAFPYYFEGEDAGFVGAMTESPRVFADDEIPMN